MNNITRSQLTDRIPIATGWTVWLTWLFVIAFGLMTMLYILEIILWIIRAQSSEIALWNVVEMFVIGLFWIGCVGILIRRRHLASMAVILAWVLAILSLIDFTRTAIEMSIDFFVDHQQVNPYHLLGTFVIIVLFAYFASDIALALRSQPRSKLISAQHEL